MYKLLLILLVSLTIFYGILQLQISDLFKFVLAFVEMFIVTKLLVKIYNLPTEMGLILLKSDKGLQLIDNLAKNEKLFTFLADAGCAMAYGLSSQFLLKKRISASSLLLGLILLGFLSFVIAPFAFYFLVSILKVGNFERSLTSFASSQIDPSFSAMILASIMLLGGLFLSLIVGIIFYGLVILNAILSFFLVGSTAIAQTAPGGTLILPGINIPFLEGVLALSIILIVHEGAHAVLARIARVPVLSSGIVLFGIIPVGAFVEPDEKELLKTESQKQTRVLVAGSTFNLITSCVFFILFLFFLQVSSMLNLNSTVFAPFSRFILLTLGLTFSLNFIVGAVNLLPMPLFDGYRLIDVNISNKLIVKAVTYGATIFFIVNFLPWLFRA